MRVYRKLTADGHFASIAFNVVSTTLPARAEGKVLDQVACLTSLRLCMATMKRHCQSVFVKASIVLFVRVRGLHTDKTVRYLSAPWDHLLCSLTVGTSRRRKGGTTAREDTRPSSAEGRVQVSPLSTHRGGVTLSLRY